MSDIWNDINLRRQINDSIGSAEGYLSICGADDIHMIYAVLASRVETSDKITDARTNDVKK
jgi:hypothetical protein